MFFSRKKKVNVSDTVFLNSAGCIKALGRLMAENMQVIAAAWFQEELETVRRELHGLPEDRFVLAERLGASNATGHEIVFYGHYPVRKSETELCERLGISDMKVFMHLDMPLLGYFGSERIKEIILKMGMSEDESLNHPMITKALSNAQDKIAEQCITDMASRSEDGWMKSNYTSGN